MTQMESCMDTKVAPKETVESQDNYNFVQLSRQYLQDMRRLTRKNPLAQEILLYFVEHMGRTTNAIVCSYQTLMEVTGSSRATVGRALKVLRDDRWLESVKIGTATAYAVNARVFWQAARNQKDYAFFTATVIAASSEQPSDFHLKAKENLRHIPFVEIRDRILIDADEELPPPDQKDLNLT